MVEVQSLSTLKESTLFTFNLTENHYLKELSFEKYFIRQVLPIKIFSGLKHGWIPLLEIDFSI